MAYLDIAKQKLTEVGANLSKAMKSGEAEAARVMPLLKELRNVNTALTKVINGEEDEFSFDELEEQAPVQKPHTARKLTESQQQRQDFGVDLGGFNDLMNPQNDPNAFDWRSTFREANGAQGGVSVDMDEVANSELDGRTLGRMIDNT